MIRLGKLEVGGELTGTMEPHEAKALTLLLFHQEFARIPTVAFGSGQTLCITVDLLSDENLDLTKR